MKNHTLQKESLGLFALLIIGFMLIPLKARSQGSLRIELVNELEEHGCFASCVIGESLFLGGRDIARFDVSDPSHPVPHDSITMWEGDPGFGVWLAFAYEEEIDGYLCFIDEIVSSEGPRDARPYLFVVRVEPDEEMQIIDTLALPKFDELDDIDHMLIVTSDSTSTFVSLENPSEAAVIAEHHHDGGNVCVSGDTLFVLSDERVSVYDISDPAQVEMLPSSFSDVAGSHYLRNCAMFNGAFVRYAWPFLYQFDVSDLTQPVLIDSILVPFDIGSSPTEVYCTEIQAVDNRLFLVLVAHDADWATRGLCVVGYDDSEKLCVLDTCLIESYSWDEQWCADDPLSINGDYIYWPVLSTSTLRIYQLVSSENGVPVERSSIPSEFQLMSVYPNPFNPSTTITVGLPQAAELKVAVYNLLGREIAVLAGSRHRAGYHSFVFDGTELPSGIYFVRATVPGEMNQVRKVMLMK